MKEKVLIEKGKLFDICKKPWYIRYVKIINEFKKAKEKPDHR